MKISYFNPHIIDWVIKGGWLMVPLCLLSVFALYALIERFIVLTKQTTFSSKWQNRLYVLVLAGKLEEAIIACNAQKTVIARVTESALKSVLNHTHQTGKTDIDVVEKPMMTAWRYILPTLEKNTYLLAGIASTAPMMGFLGTVLGMIKAFYTLSTTPTTVPQKLLAGGIYEAMITTAAGLIVALIAEIGLRYCTARINKTAKRIDQIAYHLVEMLKIS